MTIAAYRTHLRVRAAIERLLSGRRGHGDRRGRVRLREPQPHDGHVPATLGTPPSRLEAAVRAADR